jgi:hypothetical protein
MNSFNGSRAILSGPAGGVVGYAITTTSEQKVRKYIQLKIIALLGLCIAVPQTRFYSRTFIHQYQHFTTRGQSPQSGQQMHPIIMSNYKHKLFLIYL